MKWFKCEKIPVELFGVKPLWKILLFQNLLQFPLLSYQNQVKAHTFSAYSSVVDVSIIFKEFVAYETAVIIVRQHESLTVSLRW